MSKQETSLYPALTAFVLVFLIQATLKLCGVITWSWWLVTLPLWGLASITSLGLMALAVFVGFEALKQKMNSRR